MNFIQNNTSTLQIKLLCLSFFTCSVILIASLAVTPRLAYSDSVQESAQEIYYDTLSPFCPGRALADCPTEQATNLKARIKADLESGKSREEVYENLLKEYGEHLRALPKMSGWNSLAWVIPLLIVLVGLFVVIFKIKSKQQED